MAYVKQEWFNLPEETTPISADRLNHLETQYEEAQKLVDSRGGTSVRDFGAKGDGTTDDTASVQRAVNALPLSGGLLVFPPGTYVFRSLVYLPANTRVQGIGATIVKAGTPGTGTAVCFAALGGAGWTENIEIRDLRFRGDMPIWGVCVLWGHRARNVKATGIIVDGAVSRGHVFDLQGCNGVLIENCVFRGSSAEAARSYVEAIQIDSSTRIGSSYQAAPGQVYDGTPTRNVTVRDCRFERYGDYPAPHPIGSHGAVEGRWYTNIVFENNYVESAVPVPTGTFRSVINFVAVEDVSVGGNFFELAGDADFPAHVTFHNLTSSVKQADVDSASAQNTPTSNPMKGLRLSVGRNVTDTPGLVMAQGNFTDLVISDTTNFGPVSGSVAPRLYYTDGRVELVGTLAIKTAGHTAGGVDKYWTNIPEGLRPSSYVTYVTPTDSTTCVLALRVSGTVSLSRNSGTQAANASALLNATWTLR